MRDWLRRRLKGPAQPEATARPAEASLVGPTPEDLQRDYWSPDPEQADELMRFGLEALSWRDLLRLHHLWLLEMLGPNQALGLLNGDEPRPLSPQHEMLLASLCSPASPFRPRHGFAWLGDGPPEGSEHSDQVPYSNHQGRMANAALSHLAALEVIDLEPADDQGEALRCTRVAFIAFDELMTLSSPKTQPDGETPAFALGRVLPEYGGAERLVLVPAAYGLTWHLDDAVTQVAMRPRWFGQRCTGHPSPYDLGAPLLGLGLQDLACRSDFVDEGLSHFGLRDAYQLSLAMDQDDPRFVDKCRGRGLDPAETRGSVAAEHARRKPKLRLKTL